VVPRPIGIPSRRQTETIEKALGSVVTGLRIKKGLSQAALAEKLGYSLSYISKLERGQMNATLRALFDIADSLEIDAEVLMRRIRSSVDASRSAPKKRT
jgi:transcriptional regulator with XRE-family HTH domain